MQIYVGKNGQQLGPFSLEEVNRKLEDGTFVDSDLAWYEGAAGWAPLSGVAGVVIPPPAAPTPVPAPTPTPVQPPPAVAPVRPNAPILQPIKRGHRTLALVSWALLAITFVVSWIPLLGCGSWFLVWPVALACIIMGIIVLTRGGTGQGILIILASILIVPVALVAPIISTALLGGADRARETQIMANLRAIDVAKNQYSLDKGASTGAPVTMANLTSYFSNKEIKSVVGEQYDPKPIGDTPTATLPANKTLGGFKEGDMLTVESIEKDLANSFSWSKATKTQWFASGTSPTPTAAPTSPSPSPKPAASAAPSITVSPKPSVAPSVSPRSSSTPHQLISPRQSEEKEEPPSSRPSPSAKFAPRTGPRQSPPPSDSDKSDGLRHGRQQPRESQSPAETPEKTPDDDDDD